MAHRLLSLVAGTALLVLSPAQAQEAPPAAETVRGSDIVVTGGRERADALSRGLARGQISGMLPRWTRGLCVRMIGMEADAARAFEERVRSVAREAGAPVGAAGCNPNLVVAFTEDAQAVAAHLYRRRPIMFTNRPVIERQRFVEGDDPVRWWTLTNAEDEDRMIPLGSAGEAGVAIDGDATARIDLPTVRGRNASLIRQSVVTAIGGAAVVIDADRAEGVRLNALADYVAMVALTGTVMRADYTTATGDTVMGLFSTPAMRGLTSMTAADRAYLQRLYSLPGNRLAWQQRGALRAGLRDVFAAADVEAALRPAAP
jgi:hypothetical protein